MPWSPSPRDGRADRPTVGLRYQPPVGLSSGGGLLRLPDVRGVVHEAGGGNYRVVTDAGIEVDASLRGRLKQERRTGDRVVIGDVVRITQIDDAWAIEEVEPRENELVRRGRGGRVAKVLAANIDRVFVVVSVSNPAATPELIDRLLVLAETSGATPVLVVNKADLPESAATAESWREIYATIGYRVLVTSAETGLGVEELHEAMCGGVSTLIGPSGVGKSSLLNAVDPDLGLEIGALSRKTGTGRHTTVSARMIPLSCGGLIADTPGFGDVGLWALEPDEVASCFPEIAALAAHCRFRRCAHLEEPECAVKAAVQLGEVPASRYGSYGTLRAEAEEAASGNR